MDQSDQKVRLDDIIWHVNKHRQVQPLCPKHHLRLRCNNDQSMYLECAECEALHILPRYYYEQVNYVLDKLDSKKFKDMKLINLDDEAIPLAETKLKSKDNRYFVTGILTESKVGLRLVIYAGETGVNQKSQIFVEPDIKRLTFDQTDLHPNDVFIKLAATFKDGSTHVLDNDTVQE